MRKMIVVLALVLMGCVAKPIAVIPQSVLPTQQIQPQKVNIEQKLDKHIVAKAPDMSRLIKHVVLKKGE